MLVLKNLCLDLRVLSDGRGRVLVKQITSFETKIRSKYQWLTKYIVPKIANIHLKYFCYVIYLMCSYYKMAVVLRVFCRQ